MPAELDSTQERTHGAGLLRAARDLAGELRLDGLIERLRPYLTGGVSVIAGGAGIVDPERDCMTTWRFNAQDATQDPVVEVWHGTAADFARYAQRRRIRDGDERPGPLDTAVLAGAAGDGVMAPVMLGERWLGFLFMVVDDPAAASDAEDYLGQLADLAAPVVWNCHTQARFALGDQRRATLITLGDAINRSLKLETVLESTRQALRSLAGHAFSAIMLVKPEGDGFLCYPNATETDVLAPPEHHPLEGGVLSCVLATEGTYESADLERERAFPDDERYRDLGVRRYVAAPMFVRGRIIGCLLVGVRAPTRVLRVDVWLYENIALQLALALDNARQLERVQHLSEELARQNSYLREEIQSEHAVGDMIGESAAMQTVHRAIARVGATESTVLITGETGVGKELVARAIHQAGPRAERPMVKVNCAAIPEGMVESELFGHERGAFTSAVDRRIGRFELAHDGTLFLDEVGELSPAVQAKLLRVLQDGAFERVGGTQTLSTNARIIAATNRDLAASAREGAFRTDLYYRLNVFPLHVPPLRARPEDIPALVAFFVDQFNRRMGKRVESVDPETMAELCGRHWPGNIRELRHVVERAMIMSDGALLHIEPAVEATAAPDVRDPVKPNLQEAQAEHIRWALRRTAGVIEGPRGAAALLGLKPSTLRFRMKRMGIERPR